MKKPTLLIMAAGMGSRYGGLKQLDPVDPQNHIIMDFSLFDAREAGFEKVVFVIKREMEEAFSQAIGNRTKKHMEVAYAFQDLADLPSGFSVPDGRVKPWGTAHAILSARQLIHEPFVAINADDYYGKQAFRDQYQFLTSLSVDQIPYAYAMSGYRLSNTLTENGSVSRGVCQADQHGFLSDIVERTHIERRDGHPAYTEDNGSSWYFLPDDTPVSMNLWGFGESFFAEAENRFSAFLSNNLAHNPQKCEYYIPSIVHSLLAEKKATVKIIPTADRWYGVTYPEDKPAVQRAIAKMKANGLYPEYF